MVVIVLETATEKLRGLLTRWTIETKPGVFVGSLSAMVRDKLWEMIKEQHSGGALLVFDSNNEQGYQMRMHGEPIRSVVDLDGVQLIKVQ